MAAAVLATQRNGIVFGFLASCCFRNFNAVTCCTSRHLLVLVFASSSGTCETKSRRLHSGFVAVVAVFLSCLPLLLTQIGAEVGVGTGAREKVCEGAWSGVGGERGGLYYLSWLFERRREESGYTVS